MLDISAIFHPDRCPPRETAAIAIGHYLLPPEWHAIWDERAAIMEYEGGLHREQAEAQALKQVLAMMQNVKSKPAFNT